MEPEKGLKNKYGEEEMVKVGYLEEDPIILAAVGVKISQTPLERGTIQEIYRDCQTNRKESESLVNMIMAKHRHMILGDFLPYAITLENLSRFAAIYLWRNINVHNLMMGAGIEASLRVVKPNRHQSIVSELGEKAFKFYEDLLEEGVPNQDARYLLPEATLTRMIFSAPPRYLIKLANCLKNTPLSELKEIGKGIENIVEKKFSLEIPKEEIISEWQFWNNGNNNLERKDSHSEKKISLDFQGTIHSLSLNMKVQGSLAMYAQLVRQRLLFCNIEPLEEIAKRGEFIIPPTFSKKALECYKEIAAQAKAKQVELLEKRDPNFVYFLLLGQKAIATIYGKGAGVIETSRARSEGVAQWEIRDALGIPLTRELARYPDLIKEIGPRCWREGRCIEPPTFKAKKAVCKAFAVSGGKWQGALEELLSILEEPYQTFTI